MLMGLGTVVGSVLRYGLWLIVLGTFLKIPAY